MPLNRYSSPEFTPDTLDGFEVRYYPTWVIQYWHDPLLCTPQWEDADFRYYNKDTDLKGDVGGINFRPVHLYPEDLKIVLDKLRMLHPEIKFRMIIRVKADKDLDV